MAKFPLGSIILIIFIALAIGTAIFMSTSNSAHYFVQIYGRLLSGPRLEIPELPEDPTAPLEIFVSSNPEGAKIFLNEIPSEISTPGRIMVKPNFEVSLKLVHVGYLPYVKKFLPARGDYIRAELQLDQKAFLDIEVSGNGNGEISINGKVIGQRGPLSGVPIPPNQTVTVRVFDPVTKASDEVRVSGQENTTRRITLIPRANIRGPRSAR